ncbi:DNA topoisomerase, partial [Helicobacter anatolicus]|uniref:DNA topoisomerase n=1 Tax=Helicobacter anatolicus TaxID=2905874 RepID=UPI003A0FE185
LKSTQRYNTLQEAQEKLNKLASINKGIVLSLDKKEVIKSPPKPFITSKLLKEASKKLKVSTTKIQEIAQRLFENGLITYIRTDAEVLSQDFLNQAESFFSPLYKDLYQKKKL